MMQPIFEYMNRITIFPSIALSEDGKKIAYISNITGAPQVWIGGVNEHGLLSYPKPLTSGGGDQPYAMSNEALEWIGNDQLVVVMDHHGDEQTFLRIFNLKTGEIVDVLRHEGARDFLAGVTKDKKKILFVSNRANPAAQGLYSYDLKTREIELWYQNEHQSCFWVGEKKFKGELLFARVLGNGMNTLHSIHPKTKKVTDLFTEPGYSMGPICELPGAKLLVLTNYERQFVSLATFDPKTKEIKYQGPDQWDIEHGDVLPNKKSLVLTRNVAGRSQIEIYAFPSLKKQKSLAPALGVMESVLLSKDSQKVIFTFHAANNPRDIFQLDLKTKKFRPLTDNWSSKVPKSDLVQPKPVKFSSQKREIYSWLFLPKGSKKNAKTPLIYWPHGGPQAEERAGFRPIFQYFISRGFALWAPNPTGSTGYGRDFMQAINGAWGTADLPDVENGIQWLKDSGWIDPKRMAVMGGSYGGYMTLRALTKFPEVWKAGVDIFGVSNLLTFVKTVPPDWTPFMDMMVGNPERDKDKLTAQSPIFEIEKIKAPLLVVQGAKDPRVVKSESDQVVERLRKQGTHVDYLVFEDEGHGFLKPDNELKAYARIAEFLEKHL